MLRKNLKILEGAFKAPFFVGRETASGFEGMRRRRHVSPGARCALGALFFMGREIASGFEGMCRIRHMSPVPTARLARFFLWTGNCFRLRGNASHSTHVPGAHCALGALIAELDYICRFAAVRIVHFGVVLAGCVYVGVAEDVCDQIYVAGFGVQAGSEGASELVRGDFF